MREIQLTQDKCTLVDDRNFEWLNKYKWFANKMGNTFYTVRNITIQSQNKQKNIKRKQKTILMHILIKEKDLTRKLNINEEIHHINGNGLDNRRCNLQVVTRSQHKILGKKIRTKTSSIYKGVSWRKDCKMWTAQIRFNNKDIHLGYFKDETEAGKTYDEAALKYFGEFSRLNFKE